MGTFITNQKQDGEEITLEKRLRSLIPLSSEIKILVGFFYFSAIPEIYKPLKEISNELKEGQIKILVGLDIDKGIHGIYEVSKKYDSIDQTRIKQSLFDSLKTIFRHRDFDKQDVYERIELFLRLLVERKIVLKKTPKPNHAKLYLFKIREPDSNLIPCLFITGSSNLTRAGLESQEEFNVEIKDYGFKEAEEYFDNLWNQAVEFDEQDITKIVDIVNNQTFFRKISPFEAYAYVLKSYVDSLSGIELNEDITHLLERKGYKIYNYQIDAVRQAVLCCQMHNGVLIADVVGLGKSIIACLVAKVLAKKGIVICPPYLIGDENKTSGWRKYIDDFELWGWDVRSLGKLKETLEYVRSRPDIQIVIVDEAHRFRNENTESYHLLREICRGKIVILLSATPFNNKPSDIFSLIKLFTIPKKSSIVFDENLKQKFDEYENLFKDLAYIKNYYNSSSKENSERARKKYQRIFSDNKVDIKKVTRKSEELARKIRNILEPVVIRRNRLDLRYYQQDIDLPEVEDPIKEFFELSPDQSRFYDEVIESFDVGWEKGKFKGAAYLPILYEKGLLSSSLEDEEITKQFKEDDNFLFLYQKNLYNLMRRLLVKRFESSFNAFYTSIQRFIKFHEIAIDFVKKTNRYILDKKLLEQVSSLEYDEIEEKLIEYQKELEKLNNGSSSYHKVYDLNKNEFVKKKEFIDDLENDLQLFRNLKEKMEKLNLMSNDPKIEKLKMKIKEFIDHKYKIVVFTEYIDTAEYVYNSLLNSDFGKYTIKGYGNLSENEMRMIYKNFDAQYPNQQDDFHILVATDRLSEGVNLNRAGVVINYDIPWNPVRVIQRVGRINRIGKKVYSKIYIVNFFPTEKGADIVRSHEIASTKMFMIHKILGEDSKILDPDEEPKPSLLYEKMNTYPEEKEESFLTKVRKEYDRIKTQYPEIINKISDFPPRVKVSKLGEKNELVVFVKRNKDIFIRYIDYDRASPSTVSFEDVFDKIKCDYDTPSLKMSKDFWKYYQMTLNKYHLILSHNARSSALNVLQTILIKWDQFPFSKDFQQSQKYREFIKRIIEDIREYGTISEYVLNKIISWGRIISNQPEKLKDLLPEISETLGFDFLERTMKLQKEYEEEVIVAIENLSTPAYESERNS
ncbi:MAG: helicase-related protein [bacterium]